MSFAKLDAVGSVQWPCNDAAPLGTPMMHIDRFVRGKGKFMLTEYVPTEERTTWKFPLILTTGRILAHYNVGAQTRRTDNVAWHPEDMLEIHPFDAELRGLKDGDLVAIESRVGEVSLRAKITERMQPGVVYTTFHHPVTGANVITTEFSDWATNCPEYKVTAVQVRKTNGPTYWQEKFMRRRTSRSPASLGRGGVGRWPATIRKTLVRMANQIADFFQPYTHEEAVAGVQKHIKSYWSPSMRRDLGAHVDHGGEGLKPVVIEAFQRFAQAASPTRRATAGPEELGQMASDAG